MGAHSSSTWTCVWYRSPLCGEPPACFLSLKRAIRLIKMTSDQLPSLHILWIHSWDWPTSSPGLACMCILYNLHTSLTSVWKMFYMIIYMLHRAHTHLDNAGATVMTIILDFMSAFNTIQPQLLDEKMRLCTWLVDDVTHQPQYVYLTDPCAVQGYHKGQSYSLDIQLTSDITLTAAYCWSLLMTHQFWAWLTEEMKGTQGRCGRLVFQQPPAPLNASKTKEMDVNERRSPNQYWSESEARKWSWYPVWGTLECSFTT